jgi:phosphate transport system permease protein
MTLPLRERLAERGLFLAAGLTAFALLAVPVAVCGLGLGSLVRPAGGLASLLAWRWTEEGPYGVLVPLGGTLLVGVGASLWAAPVGIGAATWIRWLAPARLRRRAREVAAALAAVPPVVGGFVGLVAVPPILARIGGVPDGKGLLAAIVVVGALALPPVIAGADRAMAGVPRRRFDAALSLGATRTQAIRAVIWPIAAVDLAAAALLGVGRALGDTMIVLLVAGEDHGLLGPVRTLTTTIARELPHAADPAHRGALYVLAAALVLLGLIVGAARQRIGGAP